MLVAGCGAGPVLVESWTPQAGTERICADLGRALPYTLSDRPRREVTGTPSGGAAVAWGDPPIVLRCGVPPPPEYRPDSQLITVDGVDWLPVDGTGGVFFTTTGRQAYVEVAVPSAYAPEPGVLTGLADAVARVNPVH